MRDLLLCSSPAVTMQLRTALDQAIALLEKGGVPSPRLTAEVLLMHAARCDRAHLYAYGESELTEVEWIHYGRYLRERLDGKPTQYITGHQEFWSLDFLVNSSVLIPRPETEQVVETALALARKHFPSGTELNIADVGTGSGCIAVAPCFIKQLGTIPYQDDEFPEATKYMGVKLIGGVEYPGLCFPPGKGKKGGVMEQWPEELQVRDWPNTKELEEVA